jgi:hypothetical protein
MPLVGRDLSHPRNVGRTERREPPASTPKLTVGLNDPRQRARLSGDTITITGKGMNNGIVASSFRLTIGAETYEVPVDRNQGAKRTADLMKAELEADGHKVTVSGSADKATLTVTPAKGKPTRTRDDDDDGAPPAQRETYGSGYDRNPYGIPTRGGIAGGSCLGGFRG